MARQYRLAGSEARSGAHTTIPSDQGWRYKSGEWLRKVRLIDDFTASFINEATSPGETLSHDTLDALVAFLQKMGEDGASAKFRKEDFVGAFKTLLIRVQHLWLAVVVHLDASERIHALQLWARPFGAVASVRAWHRFGSGIQLILAKLFRIPYARYVDDLFGADLDPPPGDFQYVGARQTAALSRWVIESLLGWELDADKRCSDCQSATVLGVDVTVSEDSNHIHLTIGSVRLEK